MQLTNTISAAIGGEITYKVINADGSVALESDQAWHNDVLDRFFTVINDPSTPTRVFPRVGSNNTPTVLSMTGMQTPINLSSGSVPMVTSALFSTINCVRYAHPKIDAIEDRYTYVFTYAIGQLVGTVREIGIEFSAGTPTAGTHNCCTRVVGFPDVPITATQQLVITYVFRMVASAVKKTTTYNANIYNVTTPIQVTFLPMFTSASDILKTLSNTSITAYSEATTGAAGALGGLSDTLNTATSNTPPAGYYQSSTITVDLTKANWAEGIKSLALSTSGTFQFTPPLIKDADSIVKLTYRQRLVRMTPETEATYDLNYDVTAPFVDLVANTASNALVDSCGIIAEASAKKYICAEIHGLPAILLPQWEALYIPIVGKHRCLTNKTLSSMEFIVYVSPTSPFETVSLISAATFKSGATSASSDTALKISQGTLSQESFFVSTGGNTTFNNYVGWQRIVIHREGTDTKIYINGILQNTVAAATLDTGFLSTVNTGILLGESNPSSSTAPQTVLLHRVRLYNGYLVSPTVGMPVLLPRPTNRTIALMTFSSGIPTTSGNYRVYTSGTVTHLPTGGPNGIPAIDMGASGQFYIADPAFQFQPQDEVTIEFDIYLNTTPTAVSPVLYLPSDKAVISTTPGLSITTGRQLQFSTDGATATGTTTVPLTTWTNITVVRRNESGNMVTYICMNGVVGFKLTNANTPGVSRYQLSGVLALFSRTYSPITLNAKLANLRITRGVIEYFNSSGFTPPVGLKTVL